MKSKKSSKNRKAPHRHAKSKGGARKSTLPSPRPSVITNQNPPSPIQLSSVKTCQELEVGDVGGFGSTEELEAHEKRCGQEATEFCHACSRNLCRSHYDLVHRDHDATGGQNASQGLTSH